MTEHSVQVAFKKVSIELSGNRILDEINAMVPAGSSTAIIGPNGAGKTTLLMALLGETPYQGEIDISCCDCPHIPRIGYVPQRLNFDRGQPLSVLEFLSMGIQKRPLWLGIKDSSVENAKELLALVHGEELLHKPLGVLSGGELQRVLLALALQQKPELLILDEPASGVDVRGGELFCELLDELRQKQSFTQLMVSHDLSTVTHHADHVICINRSVIAEGSPKEILTAKNLKELFGLHMGFVDADSLPAHMADNLPHFHHGRVHSECSTKSERESCGGES